MHMNTMLAVTSFATCVIVASSQNPQKTLVDYASQNLQKSFVDYAGVSDAPGKSLDVPVKNNTDSAGCKRDCLTTTSCECAVFSAAKGSCEIRSSCRKHTVHYGVAGGEFSVFVKLPAVLPQYKEFKNWNTHSNMGSTDITSNVHGMALSHDTCLARCSTNEECDCVVYKTQSKPGHDDGSCWLRRDCRPTKFGKDNLFSVYVKQQGSSVPRLRLGEKGQEQLANLQKNLARWKEKGEAENAARMAATAEAYKAEKQAGEAKTYAEDASTAAAKAKAATMAATAKTHKVENQADEAKKNAKDESSAVATAKAARMAAMAREQKAEKQVDDAKNHAEKQVEEAKANAEDEAAAVATAKQDAAKLVDDTEKSAEKLVEEAKEKAKTQVDEAKTNAETRVQEAKQNAEKQAEEAKQNVTDAATAEATAKRNAATLSEAEAASEKLLSATENKLDEGRKKVQETSKQFLQAKDGLAKQQAAAKAARLAAESKAIAAKAAVEDATESAKVAALTASQSQESDGASRSKELNGTFLWVYVSIMVFVLICCLGSIVVVTGRCRSDSRQVCCSEESPPKENDSEEKMITRVNELEGLLGEKSKQLAAQEEEARQRIEAVEKEKQRLAEEEKKRLAAEATNDKPVKGAIFKLEAPGGVTKTVVITHKPLGFTLSAKTRQITKVNPANDKDFGHEASQQGVQVGMHVRAIGESSDAMEDIEEDTETAYINHKLGAMMSRLAPAKPK